MSRLPDPVNPNNPQVYQLYEQLAAKRGTVDGMYRTLLNHPELTEHVSNLGTYLRFGSDLPGDMREFVILYIARQLKVAYEWVKHVPPAEQAGLTKDIIEAIKSGNKTFPANYQLLSEVAMHALNLTSIPDGLQNRAIDLIGTKGILEIVVLVGFYRMIGGIITAFDVPLPGEDSAPW